MNTITRVTFYDKLVGFVIVVIVLAGITLGVVEKAVPQYLVNAFVGCMGWVLRGGAQAANEWVHRDRSVQNDGSGIGATGSSGTAAGGGAGGSGDAV